MTTLASAERRALRARAHALRPFISIGEAGLTAAVLREIDACLRSHELIKVRVLVGGHDERARIIEQICRALAAQPVQHIGKILVIFRARSAETAASPKPAAATSPAMPRRRGRTRRRARAQT